MGSNLMLQWLQKYVIAKADETCSSSTAHLIMKKNDHITPVMYELHWLPLEFHIQYN